MTIMAVGASACSLNDIIYSPNMNLNLFQAYNGSTGNSAILNGDVIQLTASTSSNGLMVLTNTTLIPIVPGQFDIVIHNSANTTSNGNPAYVALLANDSTVYATGSLTEARTKNIVAVENSYSGAAETFYCFGNAGTGTTVSFANRTYNRFVKIAGSNVIRAYYGTNNVTWYEFTGSPCTIPDTNLFKTIGIRAGLTAWDVSATASINLTEIRAYSNMTLTGQTRVVNSQNAGIPGCTITNGIPDTGTSPYFAHYDQVTDANGYTPTNTYYPTCSKIVYGYEYIGGTIIQCPEYTTQNSYIYVDSRDDGFIKTITMTNTSNSTGPRSICFEAYLSNNTGDIVDFLPDANVYLQTIGLSGAQAAISDGLGKVHFNIGASTFYSIGADKLPTYPGKTFFNNVVGSSLYPANEFYCWPLLFNPVLDVSNISQHRINVTITGATNCIQSTEISEYQCQSDALSSCESHPSLLDGPSAYASCRRSDVSSISSPYVRVKVGYYSGTNTVYKDQYVPVGSAYEIDTTFNFGSYETNTTVSTCFQIRDSTNNSYVNNAIWTITGPNNVNFGGTSSAQFCVNLDPTQIYNIQYSGGNAYVTGAQSQIWPHEVPNPILMERSPSNRVYYAVNGTVTNSSGTALNGVTVNVKIGGVILSNATNAAGYYIVGGIPAGSSISAQAKRITGYSDSNTQGYTNILSNITMNFILSSYSGVGNQREITINTQVLDAQGNYQTLCGVDLTLSAQGCDPLQGTTSGDSCSATWTNAVDGCLYNVFYSKSGYDSHSVQLNKDIQTITLDKSKVSGIGDCSLEGVVNVQNGTLSQYYPNIRVKVYKGSDYIGDAYTDQNGKYTFAKALDCATSYKAEAFFADQTVSEDFVTNSGEGLSEIPLTIRLGDSNTQNILTQLWDGMIGLWPIFLIMGILFVFVIFNMLLQAL